jgi:HTH-type transcriptional regulator/antitoxin HigA
MEYKIASEKQYHETMILIYDLMNRGRANPGEQENEKLMAMTIAAEKFEDAVLGLKPVKP